MQILKTIIFLLASLLYSAMYAQEAMHIEGAIIIENSQDSTPSPGTIRWTGLDYEGWDGWNWVTLTGTPSRGGVYDIDGNFYKTVHLGSRIWMAENLRVTHFNDGDPITLITDNTSWANTTSPAMSYYDNDPENAKTYGALYNHYAVQTDSLCPIGFQVATFLHYEEMLQSMAVIIDVNSHNYGLEGAFKERGFVNWSPPNIGATNEYGFNGRGGGYREDMSVTGGPSGAFKGLGKKAYFWTSLPFSLGAADVFALSHDNSINELSSLPHGTGASVRCVSKVTF